jgi:anti-anti-sigma factor
MGTEQPQSGEQAGAHWTVTTGGGNTVVTLSGEIDLAAVRGPTDGILGAIQRAVTGITLVVCDLSGVGYMDSSGFHLLIQLKRSVERRGGRFVIARPSKPVRQLLRIVGVEEFFDIQD